jgi:DHA3 family macrolide efflux protein-like MFS transporter
MTPLFIVIMFGCMLFMPISSLFPLMTYNHFGGDGYAASVVEALYGIGFVLGSLVLGIWGGGRRLVLVVAASTLLESSVFAVCGFLPSNAFYWFVALSAFAGLFGAFFNGPLNALIQRRIAPEKLGRVMALFSSVMSFSAPVGLAVAGPIAEQIGVAPWFVICGFGLVVLSIFVFLSPSIKSLDADRLTEARSSGEMQTEQSLVN